MTSRANPFPDYIPTSVPRSFTITPPEPQLHTVPVPVLQPPEHYGFSAERYPGWREGQAALIHELADWYLNDQRKFLLLEAPTGVGKSIIAGALMRLLHQLDHDFHGIISTVTLNLQEQYTSDTLSGLSKSAWGRANHNCIEIPMVSVAAGPCTSGYRCPSRPMCTYYNERDAAHNASIAILNTAFYITSVNHAGLPEYLGDPAGARAANTMFDDASLIVHDEAHLLERAIQNQIEVQLPRNFYEQIGHTLPQTSSYEVWAAWLDEVWMDVSAMADAYDREAKQLARVGQVPDNEMGRRATQQRDRLHLLHHELLPARPLIEHTPRSVNFRPVWGSKFAQPYVWRHARKHLLMSATIVHPKYVAETLGIAEGDYRYITMPSPFVPMRRRIIYDPQGRVSAKTTPAQFRQVVAAMDTDIDRAHMQEKGIVHSVSYKRADEIVAGSHHRDRMITHAPGAPAKRAAIERFLAAPPGAILVSPAVGVGEDFGRGDNCRFQMFLKYPYPYLGDPVVKARSEQRPESLAMEADMAFVQMLGRGMRSADDWCTSYVYDSAAAWRFRSLPASIQAAVIDRRT